MKFSLWMILDAVEQFNPVTYIRTEETRTIENVRLFSSHDDKKDSILYIERSDRLFDNHSDQIVCLHGENYILLNTNQLSEVFNSILNWFEEKQSWYYELTAMLSGHCLLKDILNHFSTILARPLMILDASQIVLASSANYGAGSIDDSWDHMLTTGSFGVEIIEEYNRLHQNQTKEKASYLIPANPFPFPSYNRNIFMDNEFIGFISMIIKGPALEPSEHDWFDTACEAVFSWFSLYADNNEISIKQAMFKELLDGDFTNQDRFLDALNALGWQKEADKRLLTLSCISNYLNMSLHIARILNQKTDALYAVSYENYIVVLVNETRLSYTRLLQELQPLLHSSGYFGGSSNTFYKLSDLPDQFALARIALQHGTPSPGQIHACHDYILPYVFEVLKAHMKLELCHPAILTLREYDQNNHTDLCDLLYVYLQNECNQTKAAAAVNMHRNSLIRKITQIQEIADIDLSDYETRFHLMMSFEYAKATG